MPVQETELRTEVLVTDKLGSYGSGFRQLRLTIGAAEKQSR
jgi:transposase-like protein